MVINNRDTLEDDLRGIVSAAGLANKQKETLMERLVIYVLKRDGEVFKHGVGVGKGQVAETTDSTNP